MADIAQPVELTDDEFMRLQGFVPEEAPSEAPAGFVEVDPLDDMTDEELIREREGFNPVQYYNEHGEGAMDPAKLARLKKVFNARLQEGVSAGGLAGAAGRTVKGVVTGIPHMIKGLAEAGERLMRPSIAAGSPMLGPVVAAQSAARLFSKKEKTDAEHDVIRDWVDTGIAELFGGIEGEAVGLGEAVMTGIDKARVALKGKGLTDEEAGKILTDWAARTKQAGQVSQGKGATFNVVDAAKKIGVEVDPEAVQSIAAGAPLSLIAVGGVFKLVTQAGKAILTAPTKTAAMQTYKSVQKQLATAQQALKAAPTVEREAALQTAIKTAEATPRPLLAAVGEAIPSAETVAGRAMQAAGAVTEKAVAPTMQLGARALRATRPLGIPVGSIVGVPLQAAAEVTRRVGAGARALGAEVASEAPGLAAQRVQDIVRASQAVAVPTAVGTAIDTGFALGTSKTDEEARNMPGIGGALGLGVGLARGGRGLIAGEQLSPRKATLPRAESPAYGENVALDNLHQRAMQGLSPEAQNNVNTVREISRQLGGRVYIMPDEASFVKVLDDLWSKQNGNVPVPPEVSASHAASAKRNGLFTSQVLGPDGQPQNIAFVRDPAALAHEGIGHVLERTLPDEVNTAMDAAVRQSISPENWEAAGKNYTERLLGRTVENWREELTNSGIDIDPDTYLAREFRAENLDVAFRNRGEAFATTPDLYNRLTGWVGMLAEKAGIDFGARSAELEFPTSIVEVRRGERAARQVLESEPRQELIQARDTRLREAAKPPVIAPEVKPATEPSVATETQAAKDWIDANPQKVVTPESANAGKAIADALTAGQPVRVSYWAAKGTPAGESVSMRPERRAEIESQRQADNADRQLVEHNFTPYKIEVRSNGPQFIGWSRDILNSNITKFNEWLKTVDDKARVPYETDANGLTGRGMVELQADVETYMANQAKGFTGSGEHLVVPEAARKLGAFPPEETGSPVPLDQAKADTINFLFGTRIPESAGRLAPLHLAAQEVSAATLPGRVEVPVRPRGEFAPATLAKAGITEPRGVREVNPFRQWVESQAGAKPSLVEVNQRLNLNRIEEAGPSVARPVTGNVLTQAAGFQPAELPAPVEAMRRLVEMPQDEWVALTGSYKGKLGSNLTGWAWDVGSRAKTAEDVLALRQAAQTLSEATKAAMQAKDLSTAMQLVGRSQAAREAFEAATGSNLEGTNAGSAVSGIRKYVDPNYEPPVPDSSYKAPAKPLPEAAQPQVTVENVATDYAKGEGRDYIPPTGYVRYPRETAKKIARFYEEATHAPDSPEVVASYDALKEETLRQFDAMQRAGIDVEPVFSANSPYKSGADIKRDVEQNKHLAVNMSESAFGQGTEAEATNLLLEPSGVTLHGHDLSFNDLFRAVHDFYGHAKSGLTFGPRGEFNAWREHAALYSPDAQGALAAETMGQRAWQEFRPELLTPEGRLKRPGEAGFTPRRERPFAVQKNIVLPEELIREAAGETPPIEGQAAPRAKGQDELKLKKPDRSGISKAWVLPNGTVKQLGGQWHHEFINESADVRKRYGLSETTSGEENRVDALRQGFVRINYSQNSGTLTVEATAKAWPKVKNSVFDVVERNIDDIDNIQVSLFDPSVERVVDSDRSALFNLDSAREKLQNIPFITKEGVEIRGQGQPARRPVDLTNLEKQALSNEEKAEMWPEIVIPPKKGQKTIPSEILKSPLATQAGSREAAVTAFADGLEKMARDNADNPIYQDGLKWYKEIVPMLQEEYGKDAGLFAEMLSATSPQTSVSVNFKYATDAMKNFKAGKYDAMVDTFKEGLAKWESGELKEIYEADLAAGKVKNPPAKPQPPVKGKSPTYLAHWIVKNDLVPKRVSAEGGEGRYGIHSFPLLKVFARRWLTDSDAPKTLNFVQNLAGTGKEATIDVWADRTMRRIGYEPFVDRWRILPEHKRGPLDADLVFSQEAFRQAAERLGIDPMDLQAGLWFLEKQLWADNGWVKLDLGDYRTEMKKYRESQQQKTEPVEVDISQRGE